MTALNPDGVYTYDEIIEAVKKDSTLHPEFKSEILGEVNAIMQALFNALVRKDAMQVANTYGDQWLETYNNVVQAYQRYHDPFEELDSLLDKNIIKDC